MNTHQISLNFEQILELVQQLPLADKLRLSKELENVKEIINIQPKDGKAKGYQVKQIRNLIVKYILGDSDVD